MSGTLKLYSNERRLLLESLIATARADGNVSPVEHAYIEGVMEVLELQSDVRDQCREMLDGTQPIPENAGKFVIEDYETRKEIYERSLQLALADQVMHPGEHQLLERLMRHLGIRHEDQDRIWRQALESFTES